VTTRSHRLLLIGLAATIACPVQGSAEFVLLGTNGSGPGIGFSLATFDAANGGLSRPAFIQEAVDPAFFVVQAEGRHLYACNSGPTSELSAYRLDPGTGGLSLLNRRPSGGIGPCYVSLDRTGRYALVANYVGGDVSVFAIEKDGSLGRRTAHVQEVGRGIDPIRQTHAYAHSIVVDPSNRFALVADLGSDKVWVDRFSAADGSLAPNDPAAAPLPPGSGPRHLRFHPVGPWVYVISEIASTVTAFHWDAVTGSLSLLQSLTTLPRGFHGANTAAEIEIHPNGRFLYCSNRGNDSIAAFSIDPGTGLLAPIGFVSSGGRTPRFFTLDPSGRWMLCGNQESDNVTVFRVDPTTGRLLQVGDPIPARIPVCLGFVPTLP
jgi:6-phosphogluconolactonase